MRSIRRKSAANLRSGEPRRDLTETSWLDEVDEPAVVDVVPAHGDELGSLQKAKLARDRRPAQAHLPGQLGRLADTESE